VSETADLVFAGIARQAELVRTGEVSSRELVDACLGRIARLDP
jgi:amidase